MNERTTKRRSKPSAVYSTIDYSKLHETASAAYYGSRERHSCSCSHVRVQLRVHDHDAKLGNLLLKEY